MAGTGNIKKRRIGELLLEEEMISAEQLQAALDRQKVTRKTLGATLVELEVLSEETLYHFLAIQHGLEYVDISNVTVAPDLLRICPEPVARKLMAFPLAREGNKITLAICNPEDPSLLHLNYELVVESSTEFKFVLVNEQAIKSIIDRHYAAASSKATLEDTIKDIAGEGEGEGIEVLEEKKLGEGSDENEDGAGLDEAPVIRLCNYMIEDAIIKRASDLHINCYEKRIVLRYRIDGFLIEFPAPPNGYKRALASRYKIMARLDPMERRKAQDGRIRYMFQGRAVELRVSVVPSIWGENIVMRLLDTTSRKLDINDLGFTEAQMDYFEKAYRKPYGMILVTGPTGSGKTTTLYSVINRINTPFKNIMTVEDPVEYRLPHLVQVQVNPVAELTFANVLRSFLRQDPNIILVGEIRDGETAGIAVKASLTGHLVLSTLHTNDAISTITRLIDMGIDSMYVGTSLLVVCSQKLMRRICPSCRQPHTPEPELLARAGLTQADLEGGQFFQGQGCDQCHKTGFKGRIAVYEVLGVNSAMRQAIFNKANINQLRKVAKENGMMTMRESGILRWKQGVTTLEEVLAETQA
jgi:type IV pilus assembly protein PilB